MERKFIDKEMDLVVAKECVEDLINGYLAKISLYMLNKNIDDTDETQAVVQCRGKLMLLFRKIDSANSINELNEIADEAKNTERF